MEKGASLKSGWIPDEGPWGLGLLRVCGWSYYCISKAAQVPQAE